MIGYDEWREAQLADGSEESEVEWEDYRAYMVEVAQARFD